MKSRMVLTFLVLAAVAGTAAGCVRGAQTVGSGPIKVVAAFYPLAFAAQEIGGSAVTVENLTPAGAEPHDLELTPREVGDVVHANLVLYLGHGFQPAVEKAVAQRSGPSLDLLAGALRGGAGASVDPHVWLDPPRYASMGRRIGAALGLPRRGDAFARRVLALGLELRRGLARCERRTVVTSHAALGYLAARYRLRQIALEGISPEAEPSPAAVQRLVDEVRLTGATTVFAETLLSPKLARTVAREAHARTAVFDPLEGLSPAAQARGSTYFTVMRANLRALREALGCR